jgi:hypothetical protein
MADLQRWCRVTVFGTDGTELATGVLVGPGAPDIGAVDDLARLALHAARLGGRVSLAEVSPAMRDLLELAGLCVELAGLCVEVEGQTELRKEALGVQEIQEDVHPGDLPP